MNLSRLSLVTCNWSPGIPLQAKPQSLFDRVVGAGKRLVSTVSNWVHNAGAAVAGAAKKFGHAVARGARKAWNFLGRVSASPLTRVTCAVVGIAALLVFGGIALVGGLAAGAGAAAIALALCGAAAEAAGLAGLAGWAVGAIDVATGGGAGETLGDMIGPRGMAVVDNINLGLGLAGLAGDLGNGIVKFVAGRAALGLYPREYEASEFFGSRRAQIQVPNRPPGSPRNIGGDVYGRHYTGHAFDRMQERGLVPTVVEDTVQKGVTVPSDQCPGEFEHYLYNIKVVTLSDGTVKTVMPQ